MHVILLTETKSRQCFRMTGYISLQTQKRRYGEFWMGTNIDKVKPIKAIYTAITWLMPVILVATIHVINVYVDPGNKNRWEKTVSQLKNIIISLIVRTSSAKLIIAGDFNEARKEIYALMAKQKIKTQMTLHRHM